MVAWPGPPAAGASPRPAPLTHARSGPTTLGRSRAGTLVSPRVAPLTSGRTSVKGHVDMTVRVGINGFGRIGRNFFRAAKERGVDIDIVAVNDLGSLETMAHLLKYDSVMGTLHQTIKATKGGISVDGDELLVLSERDPKNLPWGDLGVDVVIESTGFFTTRRHRGLPPRGRRAARHRVGTVRRGRRHVRVRREPQGLRLRDAEGHLERQLHDQLLRAVGEGARRRVRCRAGPDADRARLHRRSAAGRRPAQGSPPCPRRGDQHRAHQHRCGASDVAGARRR